MDIRFSDTYAPRKEDVYKTLEVEVKIPLDSAVSDGDIPSMSKELAKDKLKKEAATLATGDNLEIILTNVDIRRRSDDCGMAVYDATAEAYLHAAPKAPITSRAVKRH